MFAHNPKRLSVPSVWFGHRSRRGFALLITITLLAFLVLLLVSLASLTRVETQVASNTQQLSQARQNALTALNIALGQLQKYAGPDQRVTATADLANGAAVPNPRWVGVYGNSAVANYTQQPGAITASTPRLLNWLVSGNEAATFTASTASANFGQITSTANSTYQSIVRRPTDAVTVSGGLASATAVSDLTLGSGSKSTSAVLLVGPNTVGPTNATTDYVVAPLVNITAQANAIPGLGGGTTATTIGRYAFWVGDEGMKARINLRDSYSKQSSNADQTAFQIYSFITAQRSAGELVNYDASNALSTDYPAPASSSSLDKLAALNQLALVGSGTAQTNLQAASKARFHDLTAASYGVIADAYAGGLKKDITADIADPTTTAVGNRPADTDPIFPRQNAADHVPTWGQLRAFPRTNPSGGGLTPSLPTATSPGIYPVINLACLGFDFYMDSSNNIQVAMFPCAILWNPYSTTIKAANYELGFRIHNGGQILLQTAPSSSGTFTTIATLDLSAGQLSGGAATGSTGFVRFPVQCQDIPPGECHIYCLGSSGATYTAGANPLTRAADSGPLGITNYVTWTTSSLSMSAAAVSTNYFKAIAPNTAGTGIGTGSDSFVAVLGKPNSVTNITSTTDWYQAVLDAHPGRLGTNAMKASTALSTMPTSSSGSTSALRLIAPMEGRGGFNSSANNVGTLGSGRQRWLIMSDIRAPMVRNSSIENGNTRGNTLFGAVIQLADSSGTGRDILFPYIGRTSGYRTAIGGNQETSSGSYTPSILFDVPASGDRLLSLGQFQNAHFGFYGFQGTYPFGNSWADVRIPRDKQYIKDGTYYVYPGFATTASEPLYDLSWHLNRALWDKYFVSGVPSTWTTADVASERTLPNGRMTYVRHNGATPALSDLQYSSGTNNAYDRAAVNLLVKGAFNINSTSVQAWRALLGGTYQLPVNNTAYADAGDNVDTIAPIPRFSSNLSQSAYSSSGGTNTMTSSKLYLGNRGLLLTGTTPTGTVPSIVNALANTIVAEVRTRGPFLSLADFVNRGLTATNEIGIRGALQAAIDKMPVVATGTGAEVNPDSWAGGGAKLGTGDKPVGAWDVEHFMGGAQTDTVTGYRTRFAAAPKFLTQADLLSTLGPAISARSDTFRIRTYGDVKNPVTGEITGRAWCEAVVQRMPDYLNSTADAAETAPASLTDNSNKVFGRRFTIIDFRWLTPSDI